MTGGLTSSRSRKLCERKHHVASAATEHGLKSPAAAPSRSEKVVDARRAPRGMPDAYSRTR